MTVAVVIVTYNRQIEVRECIRAVLGQTQAPDTVLLIDNASADDTAKRTAVEFPNVEILRLPKNIGGAGGFALGLQWAAERDFDWVWAMDDDAVPSPAALEKLSTVALADSGRRLSLVTPVVYELGTDTPIPSHWPAIDTSPGEMGHLAAMNCLPVRWCSFVGPLMRVEAAQETELPIADFFFHHDDIEYTSRLTRIGGGALVLDAVVHHPRPSPASAPMSDLRLTCAVRNSIWLLRVAHAIPVPDRLGFLWRTSKFAVVDLKQSDRRWQRLLVLTAAIWHGCTRRPRRFRIGRMRVEDL